MWSAIKLSVVYGGRACAHTCRLRAGDPRAPVVNAENPRGQERAAPPRCSTPASFDTRQQHRGLAQVDTCGLHTLRCWPTAEGPTGTAHVTEGQLAGPGVPPRARLARPTPEGRYTSGVGLDRGST